VVPEASAENAGDMHEFVDQCLGLFGPGKTVVIFRDEFDHVMGRNREAGLKRFWKTVTARENPPAFGSAAPDRTDAPGIHMIPHERSDDPGELLVNVRCRLIFQRPPPDCDGLYPTILKKARR